MQTVDQSMISPSVLKHIQQILEQSKWSVYYTSMHVVLGVCCIDVESNLSFKDAIDCIKSKPKKFYTQDQSEIVTQHVEGQPPSLNGDGSVGREGPFLSFGEPMNKSDECQHLVEEPTFIFTKDQVLTLIEKD